MRILDFVAGALGLPFLGLPLIVLSALGLRFEVYKSLTVGRGAHMFWRRRLMFKPGRLADLANHLGLAHTLDCVSLLRGHLTLVGPRPLAPLEPHAVASYRISVRPGLLSPFTVGQWFGTVHEEEASVEFDYVATRSWIKDLSLLLRGLVVRRHATPAVSDLARVEIDGIEVDNVTLDGAVARIVDSLGEPRARLVSFVDADCINQAARNDDYRRALNSSDLVLGDGAGLHLFSRLMGEPLRENIHGTDLFPRLCAAIEGTSHSVYLLGGEPGVAGAVATWIQSRHPACRIAGFLPGYFERDEEPEVIRDIQRSGATLLLVAFGAPDQELWLRDHLATTGARVGIGVGGVFDFFSGRAPRAPRWMRDAGLEWLYLLKRDPRRLFWRYGPGNVEFMGRMLLAAFRKRGPSTVAPRSAH